MPRPTASPNAATYLYRCTDDKIDTHLERITDEGDSVEHVIFKGGRDYVLVVSRSTGAPLVVTLSDHSVTALAWAIASEIASKMNLAAAKGARDGVRS